MELGVTVQSKYGSLLLVFDCSKIVRNYLKTRKSLCLEGRMMFIIINLTKILTIGERGEVREVSFGNLKVCTFNFRNIFCKVITFGKLWSFHIKLMILPLTINAICERFEHYIVKSRILSCCLTEISRACVSELKLVFNL